LPGDFIAERPVNSVIQPAGLPIAAPLIEVLRRPRESAQFTSWAFSEHVRDAGIAQSMGSRGDCYDNSVAESFFATLKKELVDRRSWPEKAELRSEIFDYIEAFYNRRRRPSTLGMLSPADYENGTLSPGGPGLAASRHPPTHKIRFTAPTPTAIAYQPLSTEAGELHLTRVQKRGSEPELLLVVLSRRLADADPRAHCTGKPTSAAAELSRAETPAPSGRPHSAYGPMGRP
jgi:hypothetical protein